MQDIDFEALDQEVNKIMSGDKPTDNKESTLSKELPSETSKKTKIRRSKGHNMDVVARNDGTQQLGTKAGANTSGLVRAKPSSSVIEEIRAAKLAAATRHTSSRFYDIRPKAKPTPKPTPIAGLKTTADEVIKAGAQNHSTYQNRIANRATLPPLNTTPRASRLITSKLTPVHEPKALTPKPVSAVGVTPGTKDPASALVKTPIATTDNHSHRTAARGANLLRQRRRMNVDRSDLDSDGIPDQTDRAHSTLSTSTGHTTSKPTQTFSKSLSRYNLSTLNTATSGHERLTNLDDQAELTISQAVQEPTSSSKSTNDSTFKNRTVDEAYHDYIQSPFLESAKVDKRPLGVPYDSRNTNLSQNLSDFNSQDFDPQATLQLDQSQGEMQEPLLYRDDSRTNPAEKKSSPVIWIILMLIAVAGAAVGIYLITIYNK